MVIGVRGMVASAATAVVVGLGALRGAERTGGSGRPEEARVEAGSPVVTGWAPAGRAGLHPGVVTETAGGGTCTANFVFTQGDRVFLGQAAHCAGTGEATETDGCSSATGPLGTEVAIHGSDGRDRTGGMVYSSWVAMQADGETDPDACAYNDFALVELSSGDAADVNPSMPFFGGPTGVHEGALQRRDGGARVRQLDDPARHRGTAPEGRLGGVEQRPGASATRCTRSAPASPATRAAAT